MTEAKSKSAAAGDAWRKRILIALGAAWLLAVALSYMAVPKLILDGFDGTSIGTVNKKIESHRRQGEANGEDRTREWYAAWARGYSLKAGMLATLTLGGIAAFVGIGGLRRQFRRFLLAPAAPLNLAVLRISVFCMMFILLATEPIRQFAAWDNANFQWPWVAGPLFERLPISTAIVDMLLPVALLTTAMAIAGFFSRTSAWISCLLSIYLMGIPQCSGKVNHTMHHVVLIGLILACSRCGDYLSIDSIWQAVWRADHGRVKRVARSIRYGLPIRLAMLVLSFCYFFPGFWKVASNGLVWVFSDNLQNQMLQKWFELETFRPALPLYELPGFNTMGGLTTIVFEIGFPLAILWRPTRIAWAAYGQVFHGMTLLLMNISFHTMQAMYVMFVDWQRLLRWFGGKLFAGRLVILFDGNCKLCRRTISILLALDWLRVLEPINAFHRDKFTALGLGHLDDGDLMGDMHAAARVAGDWHVAKGYAAYQQIAWRVPLLWPSLLLVYLPPVAAIGRGIYRRVADSRACTVPVAAKQTGGGYRLSWSARPLLVLATLILASQFVLGVGRLRKSWPVACYPLFDTLSTNTVRWPEFEAVAPNGEVTTLDDDAIRAHYTESRYVPAMKRFVAAGADADELRPLLDEFRQVWRDSGDLTAEYPSSIRVFASTYKLSGPERPSQPESRELLFESRGEAVAR